jgi:hypothetical protein
MSRSGGISLFIKNQTEEYIGNVVIERGPGLEPASFPTRLVIVDYTRDEDILRSPTPGLVMTSESQHDKFIGFAKYLRERKKVLWLLWSSSRSLFPQAAVAIFQNKDRIYFLPPSAEPLTRLQCVFKPYPTPAAIPLPTPIKPVSAPASNSADFLSSLIDKVLAPPSFPPPPLALIAPRPMSSKHKCLKKLVPSPPRHPRLSTRRP